MIGSDICPTMCAVAGTELPKDRVIDGVNFLPALEGKPLERPRALYWRCPIARGEMKTAMRIGDWKIVADEPLTKFELYNLKNDPQEKTDLSSAEPAKLAEMTAALKKLNTEIEAEGPDWWKPKKKKD